MLRSSSPLMSEATRELLRELLRNTVLTKEDGQFEMGREHNKLTMRHALEHHLGERL